MAGMGRETQRSPLGLGAGVPMTGPHRISERGKKALLEEMLKRVALGSRLIDRQSQKMTVAARATADRKVLAHRS